VADHQGRRHQSRMSRRDGARHPGGVTGWAPTGYDAKRTTNSCIVDDIY